MYPQILLLGDSLLQRSVDLDGNFSFQAQLQSEFIRRLDVVNRGLSGYNTEDVLRYLDDLVPAPDSKTPQIAYLILLLGANDAALPLEGTTQHIPIDQYEKNLMAILNHPPIMAHKPKILLVTPPPLDEIRNEELDMADGFPCSLRQAGISAGYSQRVRDIAARNPDVVLIDLWKGIMDKAIELAPETYQKGGPWPGTPENGQRGGLKTLIPDGLHLSGAGYRVFYDLVRPHIGQEWENLHEFDLSGYIYPGWRALGEEKLAKEKKSAA